MSHRKSNRDSSNSENSDNEFDYYKCTKDEVHITKRGNRHPKTSISDESCTSVSDESLGLLTEEILDTAWSEDSENEPILSKNFQNLLIKEETGKEPDVSPICAREKSYNFDLYTLESTPKIKQTVQETTDKKSSIRCPREILNKTIKISSIYDNAPEGTINTVEAEEEILEHNLNVTHHIEKEENVDSLNKTFEALNILNKTLPLVNCTCETSSNLNITENLEGIKDIQCKNVTESPKTIEARSSEETLYFTVTKKKKKNQTKIKKCSSWITIDSTESQKDSTESLYPESSVSETDYLKTGTKKKIFKNDKGKVNTSRIDTREKQTKRNEPRKILSVTNRDLKISGSSSAFDVNSSVSSDVPSCPDPEITPHEIPSLVRNFPTKKVPLNLSFKKMAKEEIGEEEKRKAKYDEILIKNEDYIKKKYKESAKLKGFADYKLSFYKSLKEIAKAKNKRESLDIPVIRLVEEPYIPIRTRNLEKSSASRSGFRSQGNLPENPPHGTKPSHATYQKMRREVTPASHVRQPVHPTSQRIPDRRQSVVGIRQPPHLTSPRMPVYTGREDVHINPLPLGMPGEHSQPFARGYSRIPRPQAVGSSAIFTTRNPFDPPLRGRSGIPKKSVSNKPSFPK